MKKILLSAIALMAMTLSAFAESKTVEFDFSAQGYANKQDFDGVTVSLGSGVTVAWSKGTSSVTPKYFTSGTAMRLYGDNTATFSATGNITSIAFTYSATDYAATADNSAVSTGTYDYSSQTWTGSTKQVVLSYTATKGHLRIQKVAVTFEAEASTATFDDLYVPFKYNGVNNTDVKAEWEAPVIDQENGKSEVVFSTDNIEFKALGGTTPINVQVDDENTPFPGWTAGWNEVKWDKKHQNLDDANTRYFTYVLGTGNPVIETNYEYSSGNSGNFYRPTYIYYGPYSADTLTTVGDKQYIRKLPTQGLYYEFTAKKDGKLKIAAFVNKGKRFTFVIDKATMEPVSFTCEGYINGQNEVNPNDPNGKNRKKWLTNDEIQAIHDNSSLCERDTVYAADNSVVSISVKKDNYPYTIGDGNQSFWGYLNMTLKAGQTYLMFHDSSQIGFGGFQFTDGEVAEGDLFSAEATVFLPSYIKAITNLVYNGDETFTSTAGTEVTVQFTDSCTQYTLTGIKGTVTAPEGWTVVPANDGSTVVVSLNEGKAAKFVVTFTTESAETFSIANTTPGETTAIANVNASATVAPRKVLENGRILIGNYNIAGQRVK